jgi:hypothetical protein
MEINKGTKQFREKTVWFPIMKSEKGCHMCTHLAEPCLGMYGSFQFESNQINNLFLIESNHTDKLWKV